MLEFWISLESMGFPNYGVSSLGRVRNISHNRILKGTKESGYIKVCMTNDNRKPKGKYVHVLVATMFHASGNGLTVDHIDRNKENNEIGNLRWATGSEQAQNKGSYKHKGRPICQYDPQGNFIREWDKIKDAADFLGVVSKSNIGEACSTGKISHGFRWKYDIEIYPGEEWKPHPFSEFKPFYVSSFGRIYRPTGNITKGSESGGYLIVLIYEINTNRKINRRVHRLVAATFLGRNDSLQVNHKDGNKFNNHIDNLEYMTARENMQHAVETGLRDYSVVSHGRKVMQFDKTGKLLKIYDSIAKAFIDTNVSKGNICKVCKGIRPMAGGYIWRYVSE